MSVTKILTQYANNKSTTDEVITKAEVLFAMFVSKHKLPILIADHFIYLSSAIFPNRKIAKAYSSANKNNMHC